MVVLVRGIEAGDRHSLKRPRAVGMRATLGLRCRDRFDVRVDGDHVHEGAVRVRKDEYPVPSWEPPSKPAAAPGCALPYLKTFQ